MQLLCQAHHLASVGASLSLSLARGWPLSQGGVGTGLLLGAGWALGADALAWACCSAQLHKWRTCRQTICSGLPDMRAAQRWYVLSLAPRTAPTLTVTPACVASPQLLDSVASALQSGIGLTLPCKDLLQRGRRAERCIGTGALAAEGGGWVLPSWGGKAQLGNPKRGPVVCRLIGAELW